MQVILDENWLNYLPSLLTAFRPSVALHLTLFKASCVLLSRLMSYGCTEVTAGYRTYVKPPIYPVWQIPNKILTSCTFKQQRRSR